MMTDHQIKTFAAGLVATFIALAVLACLCAEALGQVESVAVPALLNEANRVAQAGAAATNGQTNVIYLFVVVLSIGALGGFFVLRYMLTHAREIHSEANRTLLDISAKHESRCDSLTKAFSFECAQQRQVILRTISDTRDIVHATRDIAGTAVSAQDFFDKYSKKQEEIKAKSDRDQQQQLNVPQ